MKLAPTQQLVRQIGNMEHEIIEALVLQELRGCHSPGPGPGFLTPETTGMFDYMDDLSFVKIHLRGLAVLDL